MPPPRKRLRALIPFAIGLAAIVALIVAVNPRQIGTQAQHFSLVAVPFVVALSIGYYLLQGVRWHFLLRDAGVEQSLGDTVLLNMAGQSTGLLPLGELTRAVLVAESSKSELGAVVATVTVQELIYTLLMIAAAVPGAFEHRAWGGAVVVALLFTIAVFVLLTVPRIFRAVRATARRVPFLRRFAPDIDELRRETVVLLRMRGTYLWSVVSAVQVLVAITLFWLVVHSIQPGLLTWPEAAFVYAVSHIAGAVSLIPGGLGPYEASIAGLLVASGASIQTGVTIAVLHRGADKGLATAAGMIAYLIARRRHRFSGFALFRQQPAQERAAN
ncbi:MAG TPA: lysylphosphatidylglycerol synthase transmembrane domain-containing protein [Candidatus Dormibacteraeota bacterium]|nr:lysylphosphatidylglycerol synthase transmembrane domain-containing protein [Candidatus Dormibacteraeota bacterium]